MYARVCMFNLLKNVSTYVKLTRCKKGCGFIHGEKAKCMFHAYIQRAYIT